MPEIPDDPTFNWLLALIITGVFGIAILAFKLVRDGPKKGAGHACIPLDALKKISEMYHWLKELREWLGPNHDGQQPWREPRRDLEIERGIKEINTHLVATADVQKRTQGLLKEIRDNVKAWPQAG